MAIKEYTAARISISKNLDERKTRTIDVHIEEGSNSDTVTGINHFCKDRWRLIQIIQEDPIREPKKLVGIFERDYIPFEEREIEDEEN